MSTRRDRHALLRWLKAHGAIIDRDAGLDISPTKAGLTITFSWTYDERRRVALTFSGVGEDERNEAMIAWLNGEFLPAKEKA